MDHYVADMNPSKGISNGTLFIIIIFSLLFWGLLHTSVLALS